MPIPGRNKYETETTQTKEINDCLSCSGLQSLIGSYFTAIGVTSDSASGSEQGMLNYIQSTLAADNMSFTMQQIKDALANCNNGWKKNISFKTRRHATYKAPHTVIRTENFSVEAWAYPITQDTREQVILTSMDGPFGTLAGYRLAIQDGYVYFTVGDGFMQLINNQQGIPSQGGAARVRTVNKISYNKWHHVVAVRVGNYAADFRIYVDGQLQQTEIADYAYMSNGDIWSEHVNGAFFVGEGNGSYDWGRTKNMRLYRRVVTDSEVFANYNACSGAPTNSANLLLWAKLDEGSGLVAVDHSPYQAHGEMYNGLWHGGVGDAVAPVCVIENESALCKTRTVSMPVVQGYRYGFNGKENDNEVKGEGNQIDYGFRIYDPRVGRFLSVDPLMKEYPWYTPYQFSGNSPISNIDIDGREDWWFMSKLITLTAKAYFKTSNAGENFTKTVAQHNAASNNNYGRFDETGKKGTIQEQVNANQVTAYKAKMQIAGQASNTVAVGMAFAASPFVAAALPELFAATGSVNLTGVGSYLVNKTVNAAIDAGAQKTVTGKVDWLDVASNYLPVKTKLGKGLLAAFQASTDYTTEEGIQSILGTTAETKKSGSDAVIDAFTSVAGKKLFGRFNKQVEKAFKAKGLKGDNLTQAMGKVITAQSEYIQNALKTAAGEEAKKLK
jgi:RHS repeat-associated protein